MKRTARALTTLLLLSITTGAIGCATSSGAPRDVRSSATIATTAPSMLVSGPALLMHVDLDSAGDQAVLYAVARKNGTAADCGAGPSGDSLRLHGGRTNPVNLVVPAGQTACVASATAHASLRFHARKSDNSASTDVAQLLALGVHDR
jgi:hypothetical protein